MSDIERDLDIALYKLWEALHVGVFRPEHYENLNSKLQELQEKYKHLRG